MNAGGKWTGLGRSLRLLLAALGLLLVPFAVDAATGDTTVLRAPGVPVLVVGPTKAERMTVRVAGRTLVSGRFLPVGRAPLGHAMTFVPLSDIPAGTPIVVQVEPSGAGTPRLLPADPAIDEAISDARAAGLVLGVLLSALLLQLAWFTISRDRNIAWYVAFIGSLIAITLLRDGRLPGFSAPSPAALVALDALASIFYLGFTLVFLRLWQDARGLFWTAIVLTVPTVALQVAGALVPALRPAIEAFRSPVLLFGSCGLFAVAIVRGRRFPPAYYLLAALGATALAVLYRVVRFWTPFADPFLDHWAYDIGITIDALVFGFAVVARQQYLWRERRLLQVRLDEATHAAQHDALTGALNRRGLASNLTGRDSGTLLYVDLDNFKQVNDHFGHASGDVILIDVASALRELAGPGAMIARVGGDEFVVVVAESDRSAIERLAERLGERIADIRPVGRPRIPYFGASVGFAPLAGLTLDNAMRIADANSYRVKAYKQAATAPPEI
ncbi:MAG: diguanylate cyclase [Vulcanimicrobiaceae bacterium]